MSFGGGQESLVLGMSSVTQAEDAPLQIPPSARELLLLRSVSTSDPSSVGSAVAELLAASTLAGGGGGGGLAAQLGECGQRRCPGGGGEEEEEEVRAVSMLVLVWTEDLFLSSTRAA